MTSPDSRALMTALQALGHKARFVGGCVRDGLLEPSRDVTDLDIATQEPAPALLARLKDLGLKVLPTGLAHGTITVRLGRRSFEVTTLRADVATDGRRATVAWETDFAVDAARRDLTINAMSCDGQGRVFDYAGGRADLAAGRIRFMGEPLQRIREDYLRILRFFRFHACYGRCMPDRTALDACRHEAPAIGRLSGERVRAELLKLLAAPGAVPTLRLMHDDGVLVHALPAPVAIDGLAALLHTCPAADPLLRLAALLRAGGNDQGHVAAVGRRLVLANRDNTRLAELVLTPLPDPDGGRTQAARDAYRLGLPLWRDLVTLASAGGSSETLARRLDLLRGWNRPRFPVTGDDLIARGIQPGPALGQLRDGLLQWWQSADFVPDRAACLVRLDALIAASPIPRH